MTIRQAAKIEAQKRAALVTSFARMTDRDIALDLLDAQAELALIDHQRRVSPSDAGMRSWHDAQYASLSRRISVARAELAARKPAAA